MIFASATPPVDHPQPGYPPIVLVGKLLALGPLACDFTHLLPIARALREQIDWDRLRADTAKSPYAEAFIHLANRLGITS